MLNRFSKEKVTIGFYIIYFFTATLCFYCLPGINHTPNIGVLLLFLFIPISFVYATIHIIKHFYSNKSYLQCLLIHTIAWILVLVILTNYVKK